MREGQSDGLRGGSVVVDEGLEDGRIFFAAFFEDMAAWEVVMMMMMMIVVMIQSRVRAHADFGDVGGEKAKTKSREPACIADNPSPILSSLQSRPLPSLIFHLHHPIRF